MNLASTIACGSCWSTWAASSSKAAALAAPPTPGSGNGTYENGRPCASTIPRSTGLLPITALIRPGSSPLVARPSRSCRQCPSVVTSSTTRFVSPVSVTRQPACSDSPSATPANRCRSSSTANGIESARTTWRVKNHPVVGSV
jgi:hypothetical protein